MTIFSQRPGVFCTPTIGLLFAVSSVGICFFAVSSAKAQAVDVQPEPGQQVAIADEDSAAAQVAADDYELLRLFIDTLDEVERNYVKPISRRELMEAAIDGVLSKLDVYSDYIPPDEFDEFSRDVTNEFGGLGIQVTMENGELTVISPLIGTPAYEAGIVAGDVITKIGDSETKGMDLSGAIRAMKGPVNTAVNLTIRKRNGSEKQVSVTREIVRIETVLGYQRQADDNWSFWFDQDRKIGYVRITAFSQQTDADLKQALDTLKADGMKAFVLDLRFNPGGLLTSAIAISDMFLSEGRIVSTSGRNIAEEAWDAHSEGTFTGFPMVVLVNQYSASASEIVSAALQDHDRAVVIGQRTWGKGSVQRVIDLQAGKSALKLTTASYHRPNGHNIHRFPGATDEDEWGVSPNTGYEVRMNDYQIGRLLTWQQDRFLIKNQDGNEEESDRSSNFRDPQLRKAVEYLESKLEQ